MRRKITIVVLLCCAFFVVFALQNREREPYYRGKSLSQWINVYLSSYGGSPEENEAEEAVRAIGTNGIPFLIRCIGYETPPWKRQFHWMVNGTIGHIKPSWILTDDMKDKQMYAVMAFVILESSAEPAVPALNEILNTGGEFSSFLATKALGSIGKPALEALLAALQSDREPVAIQASSVIGELGTNGWPAVPILLNQLDDQRKAIRIRAVVALGELRHQPEIVVPALTNFFGRWPEAHYCTLEALGQFGTNATSALPTIIATLSNQNGGARDAATNALREIAPEMLTNAPAHGRLEVTAEQRKLESGSSVAPRRNQFE